VAVAERTPEAPVLLEVPAALVVAQPLLFRETTPHQAAQMV
jgi:hypothetical protein